MTSEQKIKNDLASRVPQLEELETQLSERLGDAADRLRDANKKFGEFVKERPGTCLIGALAIGYVLGRILRGRG